MLANYELSQETKNLFVDNSSVIQISKNPVQHFRTKHIDIRHHFIHELVEGKTISLKYVLTEDQLANILTKVLDSKGLNTFEAQWGCVQFEYRHKITPTTNYKY